LPISESTAKNLLDIIIPPVMLYYNLSRKDKFCAIIAQIFSVASEYHALFSYRYG
jgi:hypothetical protein